MLAAGAQPQTEAGLIEDDIRSNEDQEGHQHKPVEFKAADVGGKGFFRRAVSHGGGDVVDVLGHVDGADQHHGGGGAQQVQGGTDHGLVGVEADGRHAQQQREEHTHHDAGQDDNENHQGRVQIGGQILHGQRAAQGAHHHDAFETDVDNAAVLREAAAQGHQNQHRGKDQSILQQQDHWALPPFSWAAARFSSRLSRSRPSQPLKKKTKPQR